MGHSYAGSSSLTCWVAASGLMRCELPVAAVVAAPAAEAEQTG